MTFLSWKLSGGRFLVRKIFGTTFFFITEFSFLYQTVVSVQFQKHAGESSVLRACRVRNE